ncbi:protein kinase domain-containing protein [Ruegeria arenilitoris]|uniref:Serine/threonine-protein kinase PrkC n=1 Tax=Ruegeria arenilitoris TaxID=1173585 RepID=A0A238KCQ3_9RHOB|nr:protein kinase [Ruegeria arenilitoris]SMX40605.1 Serine/threonine-protein kinase PrkC [Ruegeria arenilitoris]
MNHNQAVGASHDEPQIQGLQPGAKLLRGQYEILRFLSNGGFGITYLARDSLERDVVIKECYPGALCRRNGDLVEPNDPAFKDDLRAIIDLFIQEARNHARLVHPNIVDVHQVFEDNDTAYIAMDLIRGCDLLDYIEDPKTETGPDFIVQVTEKMLSAVSFIHQSGMLHRDISPDNILIDENGEPILIDFGAAREQAANQSAALLTLRVIKDGYSPHEFYVRGSEQGPSSDLYVLAATLYHAISGERPIDGQSRLNAFNNGQKDPYQPLTGRFQGYPDGFLEAIDKAMEVHATDRLQSALDWLRMFRGPGVEFDSFAYRPVSVIVALDRKDEEAEKARIKAESENAEAVVTALLAGNSDLALGHGEKNDDGPASFAQKDEPAAAVDTVVQKGSGGNGKLVAGVAAIAILAAGGFFVMSGGSTETDPTPIQTATPTETAEPAETQTAEPVIAPEATKAEETAAATETEQQVAEDQPVEQAAAAVTPPAVETQEEVAQPEEPVEVAAVAPSAPVNLAETQVSYAHWDVKIPFSTAQRRASTGNIIAITGVDAGQNMSTIGEWVQRGAAIYTLNGNPVRAGTTLAAQVLDNLQVDPDGYIRVAARYRPIGQTRAQNGLLALPAIREFGLANGYSFEARGADLPEWQTVVAGSPAATAGGLQTGDILVRETVSGTEMIAADSLDTALNTLVSENKPEARLVVLRNGAETTAVMPLAQE